jgi:6-phosphogluconate dehydrogenase
MVRRLVAGGHRCVVFDRSPDTVNELVQEGAAGARSLADLVKNLGKPRALWLMVPAAAVEATIGDLMPHLEAEDILIDGGNSFYVDDIRRSNELATKGVHYVDVGTRGGVWDLEPWVLQDDRWRKGGRRAPRSDPFDAGAWCW